jgi:hypothetical protein
MSARGTQEERILAVVRAACGEWVPLPRILALQIAQYGARIYTLRRRGFNIESRVETVKGERHSWFRLLPDSPTSATVPSKPVQTWVNRPQATTLREAHPRQGSLADSTDWYERQTGHERESQRESRPAPNPRPLFADGTL